MENIFKTKLLYSEHDLPPSYAYETFLLYEQ